ncbi:hypothetical protein [Dactylococcopsis salina]|nr:hypothetical protein [Dactylococcopsis salina]
MEKKGVKLRVLAIAPDPDYSQTSYTRVLFYSRRLIKQRSRSL